MHHLKDDTPISGCPAWLQEPMPMCTFSYMACWAMELSSSCWGECALLTGMLLLPSPCALPEGHKSQTNVQLFQKVELFGFKKPFL